MKSFTIQTVVLVFYYTALLLQFGKTSKILFLLPIASKSHHNVFEPLVLELAKRNHEIILLSPFKPANLPPNVESVIAAPLESMFGGSDTANPFELRKMGKFATLVNVTDLFTNACNLIFSHERVQQLLRESTFDLVFFDVYMDGCIAGLLPHFKAPYIYITTVPAVNAITERIGTHLPPSFIPDKDLEYTDRMTFTERFGNLVMQRVLEVMSNIFETPNEETIYRKYLGKNYPSIAEINSKVNMIFMNSHFIMNYPRPLLPDIIEVGGMHCRPSRPLPNVIIFIIFWQKDKVVLAWGYGIFQSLCDFPEFSIRFMVSNTKLVSGKFRPFARYQKSKCHG